MVDTCTKINIKKTQLIIVLHPVSERIIKNPERNIDTISMFLSFFVSNLISARLERYNAQGTIIHGDQGFQYTSNEYQMWCRKFGFQISMSRKGTPLDNAVIESFHSRLKNEVMYNKHFKNINELKQAVFDWIWFYNHGRIKWKRKIIEYINFKEKYKKKNS